jgi:hypothetical protein
MAGKMASEHEEPRDPARAPATAGRPDARTSKVLLINLGVLLALLLVALIAWKIKWDSAAEQLSAAQARIEELERSRDADASAAATKMRAAMDSNSESLLRLSAVPLAWAIRAALIVGNLQRVEAYINEFSRERLVKSVLLADARGEVLLASDKSLEKQRFEAVYPAQYLTFESPTMERDGQGLARMIIPIMGMSTRAGTLVVTYNDANEVGAAK